MKVLFVTSSFEIDIPVAVRPIHMIRYLPCDLIECYSVKDVKAHISTADVVLLSGYKCVPYQRGLKFIHRLPVLTGRVHTDLWSNFVQKDNVDFDVRVVTYKDLLPKYKPEWVDRMYWSPLCIDVQRYQLPKDIDILFWGAVNSVYPFRQFIIRELENLMVGKPMQIDPFLTVRTIAIGDQRYTYAYVRADRARTEQQRMYGYYGYRLYRLLSRARVCCTGPARIRVPVGKYFEHAAGGAVSLSPEFTDSADLGFIHGETIWFTDSQHFIEDLQYLLENRQVTDRIGEQARDLIQRRHTPEIRAGQLYNFLHQKLGELDGRSR